MNSTDQAMGSRLLRLGTLLVISFAPWLILLAGSTAPNSVPFPIVITFWALVISPVMTIFVGIFSYEYGKQHINS